MPQTVRIKVYNVTELEEKVKQKVLDKYRCINTEDIDWWDNVYDEFSMLCATIGVDVDLQKTYFRLRYGQGDGATFTASVNLMQLVNGIKEKAYLSHAPQIKEATGFNPSECPVSSRVLSLIENGTIDLSVQFKSDGRFYSTNVDFEYELVSSSSRLAYKNIQAEMDDLVKWIKEIGEQLDRTLYRLCRNENDELTKDEQVIETLNEENYLFLEDGTRYKLQVKKSNTKQS